MAEIDFSEYVNGVLDGAPPGLRRLYLERMRGLVNDMILSDACESLDGMMPEFFPDAKYMVFADDVDGTDGKLFLAAVLDDSLTVLGGFWWDDWSDDPWWEDVDELDPYRWGQWAYEVTSGGSSRYVRRIGGDVSMVEAAAAAVAVDAAAGEALEPLSAVMAQSG